MDVITDDTGFDWGPTWSPDGEQIAFVSDRDGDLDIYTMDPDGQNVRQLTDMNSNDVAPDWSPDGTQIAFGSNPGELQFAVSLFDSRLAVDHRKGIRTRASRYAHFHPRYFAASSCFGSTSSAAYDFSGVSSPSSSHTAEDGEIDEPDAVIENGTFSSRRGGIPGWALWGEAATWEYSNLVGSDNLRYQGNWAGFGDNAAMIFEFNIAEDPACITQIDVDVEVGQGFFIFDLLFVYLWDYNTNSYLVGGSMNGFSDSTVSFSVTTNPGDYVQNSDGQLTVFVVNEDTANWIRVDDITITISTGVPAASANLSGTVVPSAGEAEVAVGSETVVITLTNDTWDPTVGNNNSVTTDLINGIDSAQSEPNGWDAVVKANLDFNNVTRTSNTVVTVTLGAEPTYNITADETITVTVPATAVSSGNAVVATPTFDIAADLGCPASSTTYDFSGVSSPSSSHAAEDGEIDEPDAVIENGTFGSRRGGIPGWALWGEAATWEYSNLVGSDNLRYQGNWAGFGDNAAMIFEFNIAEDPACITQIDVDVEVGQGFFIFDLLFVYLWDYNTNSYLVGGSKSGAGDSIVSFSVTTNPGDYVQNPDGQLTFFVVNEETDAWIRIDDITITITE